MRVVQWLFPKVEGRKPVRYPRTHERVNPKGLRCPLGEVVDVSEGGMRVRCFGKPAVEIGINTKFNLQGDRQGLSVAGRVVWVKRLNWKQYEIGVRFVDLLEPVAKMLMELARNGFVRVEDHAPKKPPNFGRGGSTQQSQQRTASGAGASASDASSEAQAHDDTFTGISASIEVEDLYMMLGVAQLASQDTIHQAYRALARKLHPDHNKAPDASEKFSAVHKAYTILRDPIKRRKYDAMLHAARASEDAA